MKRSRLVVTATAITAGLVGIVGYEVASAGSQAVQQEGTSVIEQNLDDQGLIRVHEQGTASVSLAGTPSVNVQNFPATQPVSGTVDVGNFPATQPVNGTVNVGNEVGVSSAPDEPVWVRSVDVPERPFQKTVSFNSSGCESVALPGLGRGVTVGFVIETIAALGSAAANKHEPIVYVRTAWGGNQAYYPLPVAKVGGGAAAAGIEDVRVYAESPVEVCALFEGNISVSLSGHLIEVG